MKLVYKAPPPDPLRSNTAGGCGKGTSASVKGSPLPGGSVRSSPMSPTSNAGEEPKVPLQSSFRSAPASPSQSLHSTMNGLADQLQVAQKLGREMIQTYMMQGATIQKRYEEVLNPIQNNGIR